MVSTSFKDIDWLHTGNLRIPPSTWRFATWTKTWSHAWTGVRCEGMQPLFMNSVKRVMPSGLISSIIGAFNGYVLTHWRFRGADALLTMLLMDCFIPLQTILLPRTTLLLSRSARLTTTSDTTHEHCVVERIIRCFATRLTPHDDDR